MIEGAQCGQAYPQINGAKLGYSDVCQPETAMPSHPIENAIERLSYQIKGVQELSVRLGMAADRLYGPVPEAASGAEKGAYHGDGMTGRLLNVTDALAEALNTLAFNVGRHDR